MTLFKACRFADKHPTVSLIKICEMFGNVFAPTTLSSKISEYHLYKYKLDDYLYYLTDEEVEPIHLYINNPDLDVSDIINMYEIGLETFKRRYKIITGEKWISPARIAVPKFNFSAFKEIKTEDDAYWLGFITENSTLNPDTHTLEISAIRGNYEHIQSFQMYIQDLLNEKRIRQYKGQRAGEKTYYKAKYQSDELFETLENRRLREKKTIKFAKESMLRAYIRGLIDGNGAFIDNELLEFTSTKENCMYLYNYFSLKLKPRDKTEKISDFMTVTEFSDDLYSVEVTGPNANTLLKYLYSSTNLYLPTNMEIIRDIH